jgi:hypothetical protein
LVYFTPKKTKDISSLMNFAINIFEKNAKILTLRFLIFD